jgi:carbon-monoxide dehydrogenase medium subunit
VRRIEGVTGIERRNGALWIGAGTTQAVIERSSEVATAAPLVARATPYIGHFQIRNRGTLGGSIAHADPAAEYPAVALALDAKMDVLSPRGRRTVPASEFFTGLWSTALEHDDLLTGVTIPIWTGRCGFAIEEFARRDGDFAIAGAAVGVALDADDSVRRCAIGLIGLASMPTRASGAEARALGGAVADVVPEEVAALAVSTLTEVPSDLHGSADFRTKVGAVMVARAWSAATAEALNG